MDLEIFESPAFWLLGGGAVIAETLGYVVARNQGLGAFPLWQFIVLVIGSLVAAAFFASRE